MKKPPVSALQSSRIATVLAVDPVSEDHAALVEIFNNSRWDLCPDCRLKLRTTVSSSRAMDILRTTAIPIALCESDLQPGTWREFLDQMAPLREPPFLIVTSRLADEYLWAEALNLGIYDVLAKPYNPDEVTRVVSMAWLHWCERYEHPLPLSRAVAAAM